MKKRILAFVMALLSVLSVVPVAVSAAPASFGSYIEIEGENGFKMGYKAMFPSDFDPKNHEYNLLIWFHVAGNRGNNGTHVGGSGTAFMQKLMATGKFVIIAPQCPEGYRWATASESWYNESFYDFTKFEETVPMKTFIKFLKEEFIPTNNIKDDSIVVTGASMGGFATWYMAAKYNDMVSVAIPVCGGSDPDAMPELLKDTHIYAFHAEEDNSINIAATETIVPRLKAVGADISYRKYDFLADRTTRYLGQITEIATDNHGADWDLMYSSYGSTCTSANWAHWIWNLAYGEKDVQLADWVLKCLEEDQTGTEEWDCPFSDVKPDDWFYDDVRVVLDKKLMNGTSDTTFSPELTTNRAMIVTMLWRLEGRPGHTSTMTFTDLEEGSWYYDAVFWANNAGIVTGYSETQFAPNDNITREQLATILARYANYKKLDTTTKIVKNTECYADSADISSYASDAICFVTDAGIMNGNLERRFEPKREALRAEATAAFANIIELIG